MSERLVRRRLAVLSARARSVAEYGPAVLALTGPFGSGCSQRGVSARPRLAPLDLPSSPSSHSLISLSRSSAHPEQLASFSSVRTPRPRLARLHARLVRPPSSSMDPFSAFIVGSTFPGWDEGYCFFRSIEEEARASFVPSRARR